MERAPVRWDSGIWDIGSRKNMGKDAIPTLYDASVSGYLPSEYMPGVGYGNQLAVISLIETSPGDPYPLPYPSGRVWVPVVQGGYYYIGRDEYYLFASKVSCSGVPTSGRFQLGLHDDMYPTQGAPIIVTSGVSEFLPEDPWGKTYEPTPSGSLLRTPTKYRKRVDLTGRKEYWIDPSGEWMPYSFEIGDYEFVFGASGNHPTTPSGWYWYIDCYPSGFPITVEMEDGASGYFTPRAVDFNGLNTYECNNTFLTLVPSGALYVEDVSLSYASRYIPVANQTYRVLLIAAVKDRNGCPISGATVVFDDDSIGGAFSPVSTETIWDGTAHTYYTVPSVNHGITVAVTCSGVVASGWFPIGK